ncbi:MAG TPA: hydrogenase maturation protease [Gaiellaceae bacterium]|nr:hydrogenase maturation protease [Gaiellaceae bacterium]
MHLLRDALPAPRGGAALKSAAVCLGSPFRGDDAVGPEAAERLRAAGVPVLDCADEPTRLLDRWDGLDTLVVVDAVSTGALAGTLHRVDAGSGPLPRDLRLASTHALGVADALELGRTLGRAPRRVVVLGIEGKAFGMGDPMTPAVTQALDALVEAALAELAEEPCTSAR